jgi:hypothetical protein
MGLLAALGDSGHSFAKVETRRVEIDKDTETMAVTFTLDPGPVMHFGPVAIEGLERLDPAYVEGRLRWQRGEVYDASPSGRISAAPIFWRRPGFPRDRRDRQRHAGCLDRILPGLAIILRIVHLTLAFGFTTVFFE